MPGGADSKHVPKIGGSATGQKILNPSKKKSEDN